MFAESLSITWTSLAFGWCLFILPIKGQPNRCWKWRHSTPSTTCIYHQAADIRGNRKCWPPRVSRGLSHFLVLDNGLALQKCKTMGGSNLFWSFQNWEIIREDEATPYGNHTSPSLPPSSHMNVQTHLAEELNARLAVSGTSATSPQVPSSVRCS